MDNAIDYKKLGLRIREIRLKNNLTQEQLSERVGLSSVYISHIENASTKPSLETVVKICNALGTTPDFLLYDSLYESREYIHDDIAALLKSCSNKNLELVTELIRSVLKVQG